MQDYRKLNVWELAHELVLDVYRVTADFPANEKFGLTNQIRRAAVSIPSNIVEGSARSSNADFSRFVSISMGSAAEVEYQLYLAYELKFVDEESYHNLASKLEKLRRMLNAFNQKLKTKNE